MSNKIHIKENSYRAKLAAKLIKTNNVALVINKTIYLYNVTQQQFLQNKTWLTHELVHVQQYKKLGTAKFLFLYFLETIKKGYSNNKFEVEAKENEHNHQLIKEYTF